MREVVKLRLGGAEQLLRPTWEAYADIEARTGFSVRMLWMRIAKGEATLRELAVIVAAGLRAADGDKNVSETKAMQLLFEDGPWEDETVQPISEYLEHLGWTPEQRKKILAAVKELEAETTKTTSASSSPFVPQSTV